MASEARTIKQTDNAIWNMNPRQIAQVIGQLLSFNLNLRRPRQNGFKPAEQNPGFSVMKRMPVTKKHQATNTRCSNFDRADSICSVALSQPVGGSSRTM